MTIIQIIRFYHKFAWLNNYLIKTHIKHKNNRPMFKKLLLPIIGVLVLGIGTYYFFGNNDDIDTGINILTTVKKGKFEVFVNSTGELQAKKSEKIRGPEGMRAAGIWQTQIADLVAEGTVVKEGDYVGRLDRSELDGKLQNLSTELEKVESQLLQAKLDTAITLRGLRDQLINLKFSMREKNLEVEQSKYEPPAVIRKEELELERIQRDYNQQKTNYSLKQRQAEAQIKEIMATLDQSMSKFKMMRDLSGKFTVTAPKPGMVIYERSWNGKKGPGSRVSSWDPVIAQLPDLSDMVSKTYVNEVDISKIKVDQSVTVRIDAFPEKAYKGKIITIANIGEQLKKFDAKVFEVVVQMLENDSILRPAMTTSNQVLTNTLEDVLFVPLECVHSDSMTYVFKKTPTGIVKQEVIISIANDENVVVRYGLKAKEELFLTIPENGENITIVELPKIEKEAHEKEVAEANRKKEEDTKRRQEKMSERLKDFDKKGDNKMGIQN
ncbi:MAG: multidrug efflux pump subunit AcrA (membrane-fusion protein) [Saprospiraceae bacterium]|jgi:multidrug efflux pump subunit AcrA (membrane-fusion protein)